MTIGLKIGMIGLVVVLILGIVIVPLAAAQDDLSGDCQFTPYIEAPLYGAPLVDPALTYNGASGGPLDVLMRSGADTPVEMLQVVIQFGPTGWVHPWAGELSGDCANLPVDDTPIDRNPPICTVTVPPDTPVYAEAGLHTRLPDVLAGGTYILTREAADSVFIIIDYPTGGWIRNYAAEKGFGCVFITPYVPTLAVAQAGARLWEWSGVAEGHQLGTLAEGEPVAILAGPEQGPIRFDTDDVGEWWQVAQGDQIGWVWAARLDFGAEPSAETGAAARALENAVLWATPDLWVRHVIDYVAADMALRVIAGPVQAVNSLEPTETGGWYYYVQPEGGLYAGWLAEEVIAFE